MTVRYIPHLPENQQIDDNMSQKQNEILVQIGNLIVTNQFINNTSPLQLRLIQYGQNLSDLHSNKYKDIIQCKLYNLELDCSIQKQYYQKYYIRFNQYSINKLNKLTHIYFSHLQTLIINNLCITNIQSLAFLNAPHLKFIDMHQNQIISIKPLKNSHLKNLQKLFLSKNNIHSLNYISRGNFPKLRNLDFSNHFKDDPKNPSIIKKPRNIIKDFLYDMKFLIKSQHKYGKNIHQ